MMLKPIIKYQGGKSKELPIIKQMLTSQINRVVEPFCGGAAVSFGLGHFSLMSDINRDVINLYSVVANDTLYSKLQRRVNELKSLDHDDLEKEYYQARDIINQDFKDTCNYDKALSYVIVRQLCFSGMERYNSNGKFNVPFGHYKRFSCNLSADHHNFLKTKCVFRYGSFVDLFDQINQDDFIFIDPPYLERLGYTEGDGGLKLHEDLLSCLKATSANWMIVHSDHEFYRENYKEFNIIEKDFMYAQRFGKNKDHSGAQVQHLYITNYETTGTLGELAQDASNPLLDALY